MSVNLHLFESEYSKDTDENVGAKDLYNLFQDTFSSQPTINGDLYIIPSVQIYGQELRDIDIVVMGEFSNWEIPDTHTKQGEHNRLTIKSFLVNIELKSTPSDKIKKEGGDYFVHYNNTGWHNASNQCSKAKFSLRNHILEQLYSNLFVVDLLWFKSLSIDSLDNLRNSQFDNAFPSSFSSYDFITTIARIASISYQKKSILNTFRGNQNISILDVFNFLTEVRKPKGLTLRKFNAISISTGNIETQICDIIANTGSKLNYLSGRAGTGKTILLLQVAYQLVEKKHKRCKILTYNLALVNDIQRIIDFTRIPDSVDKHTLSISTFDSFFQSILKDFHIIDHTINPNQQNYSELYNQKLMELKEKINQILTNVNAESIKDTTIPLDWDYMLIDEGQDVSDLEKEILFSLYSPKRLIISDGIDQFVKNDNKQDWTFGFNESTLFQMPEMKLERRQKNNIVRFLNAFSNRTNLNWNVIENSALPGGKIIVNKTYTSDTHIALVNNCRQNECENYDILILEPPKMRGSQTDGTPCFKNAKAYKEAKIEIFDGFNPMNRAKYATHDQCRLYQYDSCRGLEGWCVICDQLDELIEYKKATTSINEDSYLSRNEQQKRAAYLWALIPMSRPIDTLVITLNNPDSEIGNILKKLCNDFNDFAIWNID